MDNKKIMNVAVAGVGTVGYGVADMLQNKCEGVKLYALCDRSREKFESLDLSDIKLIDDYKEIYSDENIDCVVELFGGEHPAYELITESLKRGKLVVTANKEVVAKYYTELSDLLNHSEGKLLFEASVCGCIPIINSLYNYKKTNRITKVEGILNGSTNYVLSLMQNDGVSFKDAVQKAQKKGFLESDTTADMGGLDLMRKIVILSDIAYGIGIDIEKVYRYPLDKINDGFVSAVNDMGYTLKYMAESILTDDKVSIRVEPVAVKKQSFADGITYERNYVSIYGDTQEKLDFIGLGAGRYPTATAVVSDILMMRDSFPKMELNISNKFEIDNGELYDSYLVDGDMDNELIDSYHGKYIVTKEISWNDLQKNIDKINFYARIK